jgi:hypothetical protein
MTKAQKIAEFLRKQAKSLGKDMGKAVEAMNIPKALSGLRKDRKALDESLENQAGYNERVRVKDIELKRTSDPWKPYINSHKGDGSTVEDTLSNRIKRSTRVKKSWME